MSHDRPPLVLNAVDKVIAGRLVLNQVGFSCPPGTITALLGPNGAGKTTSVTIATGLRRPDSGTAMVFGEPSSGAKARRLFSLVPQDIGFPGPVTVGQCLDFVRRQRRPSTLALPTGELCEQLGLSQHLNRSMGALSGGQRRRVAIALGLVEAPPLLILDEATSNLDDRGRATVWQLITDYASEGGSVLVTTHILADIDRHASRVVAMADGQVVREAPLSELRASLGGSTVTATVGRHVLNLLADTPLDPLLGRLHSVDDLAGTATWRSADPAALVSRLYAIAPYELDVTVNPMPLSDVLGELTPDPGTGPRKRSQATSQNGSPS
jgi:ABC-2 type transport system ATP-binding protein